MGLRTWQRDTATPNPLKHLNQKTKTKIMIKTKEAREGEEEGEG